MKIVPLVCSAAILMSCATASSQIINHTTQINTSAKLDIVLIAGKKKPVGLSGQVGNLRWRGPRGRHVCAKGYKKYIAASGHSAYVQTPSRGYSGGGMCSWSLNRSSAKIAENAALRSCNNGLKKSKRDFKGKCVIFTSK